jgi:plasmid stabilization system protein ParE
MEHAFLQELHAAVKARLDTVADHPFRDRDPSAHLAALKTAAARLDRLASNLPAGADPELRHYLERQSYTKALAWLESATGRP